MSTVDRIMKQFFSSIVEGDIERWLDMWDDEGVFELPFAPEGYPSRLKGRDEIAQYMDGFPEKIDISSFELVEKFEAPDGESGMVEFTCVGRAVPTNRQYNQRYVGVVRTRGGKLVHYKDFWNPLVAAAAFGSQEEFTGSFKGQSK